MEKYDANKREDILNSLLNQYVKNDNHLRDCYATKRQSVSNKEQMCNYIDVEIKIHLNTLEYIKSEILEL